MLPSMSASESNTLDRILKLHEDELIEETLSELPDFILERRPRVMFENTGSSLGRWLMFGRPPASTGSNSATWATTCSRSATSMVTPPDPGGIRQVAFDGGDRQRAGDG